MEPQAENPPVRVWRDWALVAAVAGSTVADAALRDELVWQLVTCAFGVTLSLALLWRRTQPLAAVALGFGALLAVDLASAIAGSSPFYPYAGVLVVVLVFSLFRWGSGRQAAIGVVIVLLEWLVSTGTDFTGLTDAVGGTAVLLLAATLGVSTRYWRIVRSQQLEQVRFHEREMLARDLHDTVAHHVSAITIQAQAGQVLASSRDLPGATQALETIEDEAGRALAEMRSIVGYLRRDEDRGPQSAPRGVADIDDLVSTERASGVRIDVERCGELDGLRPAVQAALYRVAQESITNARRHARNVTRVHVRLVGDTETIRLIVSDDGERGPSNPRSRGYGLVGMAERVTLLGGSLEAGPRPDQGWTVQAVIPRVKAPA